MRAVILTSYKGSSILLAIQSTLSLIHNNKIINYKFHGKQQLSVEKWLSFGGITIITNESRSGVEPHFVRLNGELL